MNLKILEQVTLNFQQSQPFSLSLKLVSISRNWRQFIWTHKSLSKKNSLSTQPTILTLRLTLTKDSLQVSKPTHMWMMLMTSLASSSNLTAAKKSSRMAKLSTSGPLLSFLTTTHLIQWASVAPPLSVTHTNLQSRPSRALTRWALIHPKSLTVPLKLKTLSKRPKLKTPLELSRILDGIRSSNSQKTFGLSLAEP